MEVIKNMNFREDVRVNAGIIPVLSDTWKSGDRKKQGN
jgi:hypothetical protein